ncbi:hypothetical protein Tco_0642453 [Tanacetum coccineum]
MENTQSRNPNITNSTSSDMENTHSVFDAKITIRGTMNTLTSIKELLGQSVNKRRRTRFLSIVFGKWLDFPAYSNENLLLNYIFQREVKQKQNNDVCPPIRVFPDKIAEPLKKVRVSNILELIRKPKMWYALSDEDSVKVCLLLVSNIVFMGRESKNYIADNHIELVDDLSAWDAYQWGEYVTPPNSATTEYDVPGVQEYKGEYYGFRGKQKEWEDSQEGYAKRLKHYLKEPLSNLSQVASSPMLALTLFQCQWFKINLADGACIDDEEVLEVKGSVSGDVGGGGGGGGRIGSLLLELLID